MSLNTPDSGLPVHPGKYIQFELNTRQETPAHLSSCLGCSEDFVLALLQGQVPVTPELAFRLQKWCNTSMVLFLEMQREFDLHPASQDRTGTRTDPGLLEESSSGDNAPS